MAASSTNLTRSAPQKYDLNWTPAELEQNYNDLYTGHTKLTTQLDGATHHFGRERTIHNLTNTRAKLEHDIKRLRNAYQEEVANLTQKLAECNNAPLAPQVAQDTNAQLRRALEQSRETITMILEGDHPAPKDLMRENAELQSKNTGLLLQMAELQDENHRLLERKRGENACGNTTLDEMERERDQFQREFHVARAECERLAQTVGHLEEALGLR